MARRLSIGENNHLTCYSLAINPRYLLIFVSAHFPFRISTVTYICDPSATTPQYVVNGEDPPGQPSYVSRRGVSRTVVAETLLMSTRNIYPSVKIRPIAATFSVEKNCALYEATIHHENMHMSSMSNYGPKLSSCGQRRLWLDWVDAKTVLSLRWAHMPF